MLLEPLKCPDLHNYCFESLGSDHAADDIKKPPPCIKYRALPLVRWQRCWEQFQCSVIGLVCDATNALSNRCKFHCPEEQDNRKTSPQCLIPQRRSEVQRQLVFDYELCGGSCWANKPPLLIPKPVGCLYERFYGPSKPLQLAFLSSVWLCLSQTPQPNVPARRPPDSYSDGISGVQHRP